MNASAKYFYNRCSELLHRKAFDTYRISLHNPYTIFDELGKSIENYHKKRIKNFDPTITSIGLEAKMQIDFECVDDVFRFGSFSKKQVLDTLQLTCGKEKDGKKIRTISLICNTLLHENSNFKDALFEKLRALIETDDPNAYHIIDRYTSWLISQLLFLGYSRKFIISYIRKSKTLAERDNPLINNFSRLEAVFRHGNQEYQVFFKLKTNASSEIIITSPRVECVDAFPVRWASNPFVSESFKERMDGDCIYKVSVESLDFWSAKHKALPIISEMIELNILHDISNRIILDKQVFIVYAQLDKCRIMPIDENLDGSYDYKEHEFSRFIDCYKNIDEKSDSREKIRSAIRFYKLGNDAEELEHKFLNYWIGFEQLFAATNSEEDSIKRIKSFFIPINAVYYWQRRVNYLIESMARAGHEINIENLVSAEQTLNEEVNEPMIKSRYLVYRNKLNNGADLRSTIEKHSQRLEQHLTRIFRVRNELVHEGRSSVDLFLITGHLRHYLLFSIEQITIELNSNPPLKNLDDVFVFYENLLDRIKMAKNIKEIFDIKRYEGYME